MLLLLILKIIVKIYIKNAVKGQFSSIKPIMTVCLFAKAVGDAVGSNLVAVAVQGLQQCIQSVLVVDPSGFSP